MKLKIYILAVSLLVSTFIPNKLIAITATNVYEKQEVKTAKEDLPEVLLRIAKCESGNRQFTDAGNLVRGRANKLDVGRFQINEKWNGAEAKKLGFDIYTWEGNTNFALYLFRKNGTRAWSWSKSCWQAPL